MIGELLILNLWVSEKRSLRIMRPKFWFFCGGLEAQEPFGTDPRPQKSWCVPFILTAFFLDNACMLLFILHDF